MGVVLGVLYQFEKQSVWGGEVPELNQQCESHRSEYGKCLGLGVFSVLKDP